ncbi:phosphopantetheine-binding protein [Kribbella sp. NPDC005582]|uniref:phosphopantetheine-binding protein n=1 Tax=Kribbella sp. NPDC005582 TaxID=3156893 RepID=UPI0033BFB722
MHSEQDISAIGIEAVVARHWREILGAEEVGAEDNFFGQGGSSLLAMRLTGQLKKELRAPIAVRWVFDHPTLAGLTAKLQAELGIGAMQGDTQHDA